MTRNNLTYEALGVSSQKEDVHEAIRDVYKGIFPTAFCKIVPDILANGNNQCLVFHADGAGTKSIIAYLAWRETSEARVFRGIAQDALVMNVDDISCTGLVSGFAISNTIGRNKFLIPAEVIAEIVGGYQDMIDKMAHLGIQMVLCGGETADVGDLVRTIIIDSTVLVRGPRPSIIETKNVVPGDCIVGLSSTGMATFETEENSGISSNGMTLARHAVLAHEYMEKYPEIADPAVNPEIAYQGRFKLDDMVPGTSMSIQQALLSPTRTYLPVLKSIFSQFKVGELQENIHGLIHCTGGGQTKCMRFGAGLQYIKDDLFSVPPVFSMIQQEGNVDWSEMYRVFNMGHRMEIICPESASAPIIDVAKSFNVDAKIVGHVEQNSDPAKNCLVVVSPGGEIVY
jgi:phosphoribosylformylglycinamidine cyclo-ligase